MAATIKNSETFTFAHYYLMFNIGVSSGILSLDAEFNDFIDYEFEVKKDCRNELIKNIVIIDDIIIETHHFLEDEVLMCFLNLRNLIYSEFIILKHLSNHSIFFDTTTHLFYEVKAIESPFRQLVPKIPIAVNAAILQYKNHIIYDGFMEVLNYQFDDSSLKELNDLYKKAKKNEEIIKSFR